MDIEKIEKRIMELRNNTVDTKPVDIDWRERLGEDCEGWQAFEACECSECDAVLVGSWGEQQHCDIDEDTDCEGYIYFSEPMMDYYYPLPNADLECDDARGISGPVVLVQFEDDSWALALSGGGMDLSWDICKAHIDLGYLPPAHFSDLPDFAGDTWTEDRALVVMAMRRSVEMAAMWLKRRGERLDGTEKTLKENSKKKKVG